MKSLFGVCMIACLWIATGCGSATTDKKKDTSKTGEAACKPYFSFDQVEYYAWNGTDDEAYTLMQEEDATGGLKKYLLTEFDDNQLLNPSNFEKIEELGFRKKEIATDKFNQLNEIFCERKHEKVPEVEVCLSIFRDILVFKKEGKIVGVAKIYFDCKHNVITGTTLNTSEFGLSGDYEKLEKLLKN